MFASIFALSIMGAMIYLWIFFWARPHLKTPSQTIETTKIEPPKKKQEEISNTQPEQVRIPSSMEFTPESARIKEPSVSASKEEPEPKEGIKPQTYTNNKNIFIPLSKLNCENDCRQLTIEEEKEYCRHYCGLNVPGTFPDGCEDLNGLTKDYCLKTKALGMEERSLCDEIADSNIQSACLDRIIENFMDKHTNLEN